jgi:transcriptional regulator with XRE-family HTH domain
MSFGSLVAEARKRAKLSQKELAARVKKENGVPISPQYLNDIEHDRRNAPAHLIEEFAKVLQIQPDLLYYWAGTLPHDLRREKVDPERVASAYKAFRKAFKKT